ncbi:hypothetical protein ES703_111816 [subsurface metagenome]
MLRIVHGLSATRWGILNEKILNGAARWCTMGKCTTTFAIALAAASGGTQWVRICGSLTLTAATISRHAMTTAEGIKSSGTSSTSPHAFSRAVSGSAASRVCLKRLLSSSSTWPQFRLRIQTGCSSESLMSSTKMGRSTLHIPR